jgi:hypothetical protein
VAVTCRKLADDSAAHKSHLEWSAGRSKFHEQKNRGEVQPDARQKDYFKGRDPSGQSAGAPQHAARQLRLVETPQSRARRRPPP